MQWSDLRSVKGQYHRGGKHRAPHRIVVTKPVTVTLSSDKLDPAPFDIALCRGIESVSALLFVADMPVDDLGGFEYRLAFEADISYLQTVRTCQTIHNMPAVFLQHRIFLTKVFHNITVLQAALRNTRRCCCLS